jgi:predicted nucleic acid-binding protein
MRICIDSSVFIQGLTQSDPAAARLLDLIGPELILMIPRLAAQEVTRNLTTPEQVSSFYRLFQARAFAFIVDEPVPSALVDRYIGGDCLRRQMLLSAPSPIGCKCAT